MRVHVIRKVGKGAWRMPWLSEAMKDVISCDKSRGGEKKITMIPPVVASERGRAQTIHVTAWMGL